MNGRLLLRAESWAAPAVAAVCVAAWEVLARLGLLSVFVFPAPSTIAAAVGRMAADGELVRQTGATLWRLLVSLLLGGVPGMAVGLLMGWSRRARSLIDPMIAAMHPVPKIAILPLFMVVFGVGELSKILVIAVSAFFPMAISAMAGVRQISPVHYEVAQSCAASRWKVLTRVVLPGSLPLVLSGTRIAANTALIVTVAAELMAAEQGLGRMIWFAWTTLRTEELYVGILMTAALGIAFNALLVRLTSWLTPWQVERQI